MTQKWMPTYNVTRDRYEPALSDVLDQNKQTWFDDEVVCLGYCEELNKKVVQ